MGELRHVFVLMPFKDEFDDVYLVIRDAVSTAATQTGEQISALRADEISKPGRITDQILESIQTADLIVSDISGSNPNVMYELGYAHALGKPAIIINQEVHTSPFDVKDFRQIVYDRGRLVKDCRPSLIAAFCDVFGTEFFPGSNQEDSDDRTSASPGSSPHTPVAAPLRPSMSTAALLQGIHLKLKFANSKGDTEQVRALAAELGETLARITVASAADESDTRNTAAPAGNCAVEVEKADLATEAEDLYRRCIGLFPNYPGVRLQYADFLVDDGRVEEAKQELTRAVELGEDDPRIANVETKIAVRTGSAVPEVKERLRSAFEANPGRKEAAIPYLVYLDGVDAPIEAFEEVCRDWKEACSPEEKWVADRALADRLASTANKDESRMRRAAEIYNDLLQEAPMGHDDRHDTLHNLATLYASLGDRTRARACWSEAYQMAPGDPAVRAAFSQRLAAWDDLEAAIAVSEGIPMPKADPNNTFDGDDE